MVQFRQHTSGILLVVPELKHYEIFEAWNSNHWDVSEYLTSNRVDYTIGSTTDLARVPKHLVKLQQTPIFCVYKVVMPEEMATYISLALPGVAVKLRPDQK